jgi:hypothetical protein
MDLRTIANQVSNCVNPNIIVGLQTSAGFTIGAGQRQIPQYNSLITGPAQIQALDGSDLKHLEGLNISGMVKAAYLKGNLAGVIRPDSKGGDLITISAAPGTPTLYIGSWLVVKVIEGFALWTKVAIVKQGGA